MAHKAKSGKADLDSSLPKIYKKLVNRIQCEHQKTTNTLTQEIASLGGRTDVLETKHDELSLAHNEGFGQSKPKEQPKDSWNSRVSH